MTRDELIEEAARIIQCGHVTRDIAVSSHGTARKIADLFFDALKEPTEQMQWDGDDNMHIGSPTKIWQAMLAASPLAPEGGRE